MAILEVDSLSYRYGVHQVLEDVSFELSEGQIAALIGRNGAGKSTLLRCLAGWTLAEQGQITIAGRDLMRDEREVRRNITYVPDTPDFYDEMTAWEHVQFVSQLHRVEDWQARALDLLEELQLEDHLQAFPFTFSRGMRYKLALCMALIIQPAVLLLDEPFGPLDALSAQYLWEHLQSLRTEGKTVLFSSHVMPEHGSPDVFLLLRNRQITSVDPAEVTGILQLLNHD